MGWDWRSRRGAATRIVACAAFACAVVGNACSSGGSSGGGSGSCATFSGSGQFSGTCPPGSGTCTVSQSGCEATVQCGSVTVNASVDGTNISFTATDGTSCHGSYSNGVMSGSCGSECTFSVSGLHVTTGSGGAGGVGGGSGGSGGGGGGSGGGVAADI